jgi:alpha-tubulin suppressor-like RCC1 family protein
LFLRSVDETAIRAKLAQFSVSDTKSEPVVGERKFLTYENFAGKKSNLTLIHLIILFLAKNWPHALLSCGSNAFNQISPDCGELMLSSLQHSTQSFVFGMELLQVACGGNQTAVLAAVQLPPDLSLNSNKISGKGAEGSSKAAIGDEAEKKINLQYQLYMWGNGKSSGQMKIPVPIPQRCNIVQLSCGHSHAGFVTERGQVFTWGSGDHGMLGHGTRSAVAEPKRIDSMKQLCCTAISCGAFHTAFIACPKEDVTFTRLQHRVHPGSYVGTGHAGACISFAEECTAGGSLYMCGLGKAGQLGIGAEKVPNNGASAGCVVRPTLVGFFESEAARVIRVSCGFHHTLVIAVPKQMSRVFSPSVYAFGYGEYGRLGLGSEDQMHLPSLVQFSTAGGTGQPFHPTMICAGEQHSVAAGREGCYAWGSNDMGQLGCSNPSQMEFALTPQRVPLPEGMVLRKIVAGGRHTAAVTHCGNVLTWGWGEEGQLGTGTEKNSFLPRPVKFPTLGGQQAIPMDIALGGTHTVVVMHNPNYINPVFEVPVAPLPEPVVEEEEQPSPAVVAQEEEVKLTASIEAPLCTVMAPVEHKPPMMAGDEDDYMPLQIEVEEEPQQSVPEPEPEPTPAPPPVRTIKDILLQREERR